LKQRIPQSLFKTNPKEEKATRKMIPRVNFVFKKLFGSENSKEILMDLINAIVSEKDQVADLVIKNPYNEKQYLEDRQSMLDIKAHKKDGTWYDIEIQMLQEDSFAKRSLFYWSRLYSGQLGERKIYGKLHKTICINILNLVQLHQEPGYHNIYKVLNLESQRELLDEFEIHFIELRKYDETLADSLTKALDRWVHFLKLAGEYDSRTLPEALKASPPVQRAMEMLERLSATKEERELYEERMKWLRDVESAMEGREEKGRQEGFEEGFGQGIEQTKRENALRMHQKGLSIPDVAECTELSEEEVRRLAGKDV
jgi:predicted transposase/invertase (TIGR01784 family)